MNQLFDCPNCGKKNVAKRSMAYPNIIVHKCNDGELLEVGRFESGRVHPVSVSKKDGPLLKISLTNFIIEKVSSITELMAIGNNLENGAGSREGADKFLKMGDIWVVKSLPYKEDLYLVLISNKSISAPHYFSGKRISPVPKSDGEVILRALIKNGILSKNPFPREYSV